MKMVFDTHEEYQLMWNSAHSGILYWKKVRQDVEGKICLQVDGSATHYDIEYVDDKLKDSAGALKMIEDSIHPEWNDETESFELVDGVRCYSVIIIKTLKKGVAS